MPKSMVPQIIVEPNISKRTEVILEVLKDNGLQQQHPNMFWMGEGEKLGVEVVRKIVEHLSLKPYQGGGQAVVLVEADNLTPEAQNAMLKTLEEPPIDSVILLGATSEDNFLPTVLSRCQIVNSKVKGQRSELEDKDKEQVEKLINSSTEERFKYIEKLEDKQKLLDDLTTYFHSQLTTNHGSSTITILEDLIQAHRWTKQNVNLRAILEYIMLKIPYG
jgi:DNA polymerase III delta prime subunit